MHASPIFWGEAQRLKGRAEEATGTPNWSRSCWRSWRRWRWRSAAVLHRRQASQAASEEGGAGYQRSRGPATHSSSVQTAVAVGGALPGGALPAQLRLASHAGRRLLHRGRGARIGIQVESRGIYGFAGG